MPNDDSTGISWTEHGTGVPVVVLHGLGVDHRMTHEFVESVLSGSGTRRLHLDLPGHGRSSSRGITSSDDVVDRVAALLDRLLDDEPRAYVGNSFGGAVARALTARDPDRSLGMALIAPMVVADTSARDLPDVEPVEVDADLRDSVDPEIWDDFTAVAHRHTRRHWDLYVRDAVPGLQLADKDAVKRITEAYELASPPEGLVNVFDRPVTFILGRQDTVVGWRDAAATADTYPRTTFVVADGAGHNPHHEQPALSAAALSTWADEVLRA